VAAAKYEDLQKDLVAQVGFVCLGGGVMEGRSGGGDWGGGGLDGFGGLGFIQSSSCW